MSLETNVGTYKIMTYSSYLAKFFPSLKSKNKLSKQVKMCSSTLAKLEPYEIVLQSFQKPLHVEKGLMVFTQK